MKFECPHCGGFLTADDWMTGMVASCAACGEDITIPRSLLPQSPVISECGPLRWATHCDTETCFFCENIVPDKKSTCIVCLRNPQRPRHKKGTSKKVAIALGGGVGALVYEAGKILFSGTESTEKPETSSVKKWMATLGTIVLSPRDPEAPDFVWTRIPRCRDCHVAISEVRQSIKVAVFRAELNKAEKSFEARVNQYPALVEFLAEGWEIEEMDCVDPFAHALTTRQVWEGSGTS
jgi:hypothetical protein